MTAIQTLRDPKAERLPGDFALRNRIDIDEPEETLQEWYRRWCREVDEREKRDGSFDREPPTMEEIVAIVKEVRAEMYEEEQNCKMERV